MKAANAETRVCRKCDVEKPLTAFPKASGCLQGRRSTCHRCHDKKEPVAPPIQEAPPKRFFRPLDSKRYIITSAQNATPVHPLFWETLKTAAAHLKAELVVIPLRYKNPTSVFSKAQQDQDWWDSQVEPYLFNARKKLNSNIVLVADVKTQPTASSPLTGFESLTGSESCIIGHPKYQLITVPVPNGRFPKILTTTGACTKPNYTDTKAGKLGEFHHHLGAVIVEVKNDKVFHLRELNADKVDGSFTDLDKHYTPGAVMDAPPALGLVMGDTHVRVTDPDVDHATFGVGGMVDVLDPETLVFHDLFDGSTVNPHEVGNPFISEAKRRAQQQDVEAELKETVDFVNVRGKDRNVVIVDSNHIDFLERWAIRTDFRTDLKNAKILLKTQLYMLESAKVTPRGAEYAKPFPYWMKELGALPNIRCLQPDESFMLGRSECSLHGHNGPGGAKGTIKNLSRLGVRVTTAHGHVPGAEEGNRRVGTSTFRRQPYQHGPNANLNAHCVHYATGARSLLFIIGREWRNK